MKIRFICILVTKNPDEIIEIRVSSDKEIAITSYPDREKICLNGKIKSKI